MNFVFNVNDYYHCINEPINTNIDDKIRSIIGFGQKTIKNNIIYKTLSSLDPVNLYYINKSENLESLKRLYKYNFYNDFVVTREVKKYNSQLKLYDDIVKSSHDHFLNVFQGGKYIENYSEYEITLIFLIRIIELQEYCIPQFKLSKFKETVNFPNFYEDALLRESKNLKIQLSKVYENIYPSIKEKYMKKRTSTTLYGINLYDSNGLEIFKVEIECLKKHYTEIEMRNFNKQQFKIMEFSPKTLARRLCLDEIKQQNEEEFKNCYSNKLLPENNNYQMNYTFVSNILKNNSVPPELDEIENDIKKINYENTEDKLNSMRHTILGFTNGTNLFRSNSHIYNLNILSGHYDWINLDKSFHDKLTSCGLVSDLNIFSNLLYSVLINKYNELLFPCRFFLPKLQLKDKVVNNFDLSELNTKKSLEFNIDNFESDRGIIKYDDTIGIITIKSIKNGFINIKYIFVVKMNQSVSNIFYTYTPNYKVCDIYNYSVEPGLILKKKPVTHYELLLNSKIFNGNCYSLIFDGAEKYKQVNISDKKYDIYDIYKGIKTVKNYYKELADDENNINLIEMYNNMIFFSNHSKEMIVSLLKSKVDKLKFIKGIRILKISENREEKFGINQFKNFILTESEKIIFNQTGGNKIVNIQTIENNLDYDEVENLNNKNNNKLTQTLNMWNKLLDYDISYSNKLILITQIHDNLILKSKYFNLYNKDVHSKIINALPEPYSFYIFKEIEERYNIKIQNKKIMEISNSIDYPSFKYRKTVDKITLINFVYLSEHVEFLKMKNKMRVEEFDKKIKKNNNIDLNIIYKDIFQLVEQCVEKVDLINFRSDLFYSNGLALTSYFIINFIILVCVINYLKKGGSLIFDIKLLSSKQNKEIYYLLSQIFETTELFYSDLNSFNPVTGTFIVCKNFKGEDYHICEEIKEEFIKLKELYPNGVNDINFSSHQLKDKYNSHNKNIKNYNTKLISSYLNIKIPNSIDDKINKLYDKIYSKYLNKLIELEVIFNDYVKTKKCPEIKITLDDIKNSTNYFDKYNISYNKDKLNKLLID
uniref:Uncharacterized protein n=1 Tax=viral metagenome TaxID=1070528 RepID=A0A6C0ACX1_9ZZZZ